jgi:hypothetical protein
VHYFSLKITAKASMALVASNVQKKKGCQVGARNQGDIGAHELYCHGI